MYDSSQDVALIVNFRETEGFKNYYRIRLPSTGNGSVTVHNPLERQIASIEKTIPWLDEKTRRIKVSLQDSTLLLYEVLSNTLLLSTDIAGADYMAGPGNIRLGIQLSEPNQKVMTEFDNIAVYRECPPQ